jgi:hypothetical protein
VETGATVVGLIAWAYDHTAHMARIAKSENHLNLNMLAILGYSGLD